jgi:hypothetical protein
MNENIILAFLTLTTMGCLIYFDIKHHWFTPI